MREARLQSILEALARDGQVANQDLEERLAVSSVTLRRDLDELQRRGMVRRVHGGAVRVGEHDPGFAVRAEEDRAAKVAIGRAAAALLRDRTTCYLDAGSTPLQTAHAIATRVQDEGLALQVVTPAADIALALAGQRNIECHLLGGPFHAGTRSVVGPVAVAQLQSFHVDVALLGMTGIDARSGWTNTSPATVEVKQAALTISERAVVVADAGKWQRTNFYRVATWKQVDDWVCDDALSATARRRVRAAGMQLHIAPAL